MQILCSPASPIPEIHCALGCVHERGRRWGMKKRFLQPDASGGIAAAKPLMLTQVSEIFMPMVHCLPHGLLSLLIPSCLIRQLLLFRKHRKKSGIRGKPFWNALKLPLKSCGELMGRQKGLGGGTSGCLGNVRQSIWRAEFLLPHLSRPDCCQF